MITRISSVIRPKGSDLIFDHPYNADYLLLFGAQALAPRQAQIRRIWRVGACGHLCTATVVTLVFLTGIDGAGARSRRPDHPSAPGSGGTGRSWVTAAGQWRGNSGWPQPAARVRVSQRPAAGLPEIEHLRRPAQNHPGITQVSREVIGRALRGALEQRLCVQGFLIVDERRATSDRSRLRVLAWLRRTLNAWSMSRPRRSASLPLACSMMTRLFSAVCSCSFTVSLWRMLRSCSRLMVATSASAWPMRMSAGRRHPGRPGTAPRGGPSPTGPRLGAAQHRDLVPQHEQFRILERRRTTQQDKPASKPHEDQIEQTQRHGRSSCPTATPHLSRQVTAIGRRLAPHRRIAAAHRPGRLLAPPHRQALEGAAPNRKPPAAA